MILKRNRFLYFRIRAAVTETATAATPVTASRQEPNVKYYCKDDLAHEKYSMSCLWEQEVSRCHINWWNKEIIASFLLRRIHLKLYTQRDNKKQRTAEKREKTNCFFRIYLWLYSYISYGVECVCERAVQLFWFSFALQAIFTRRRRCLNYLFQKDLFTIALQILWSFLCVVIWLQAILCVLLLSFPGITTFICIWDRN